MAISLLPGEVAKKRTEARVTRFSFLGALGLLLGVAAVTAGVFVFKAVAAGEVRSIETQIEQERKKILAQKDLEIKVRTLEGKVKALEEIFAEAEHYSILLDSLILITPAEISFSELSAQSPEKVSLSGTASSYIGLARFIKALNESEEGSKLFSEVEISSVSLDAQTGQIKFSLEQKVREELLR